MQAEIVEGDLLGQPVDAIVNAWNRNLIPWWLLWPQGVAGAIRRTAGTAPFHALPRFRLLPLGGAVLTGAGRLPYKGIIHVAAINLFWRSGEGAVKRSVHNAMAIARDQRFQSIAFPVLGSGTGGLPKDEALRFMQEAFAAIAAQDIKAVIVIYKDDAKSPPVSPM